LTLSGAHDQHRLADVVVFDPVARFGNLFKPAGHLPGVRPQVVKFRLIEFRVEITLDRNAFRIVDRKRHGTQAAIC
jgi:hypothetical protein